MYNAVKKFLALYHHLSLPGIGNFKVTCASAQLGIADRNIIPSIITINFSTENLPAEKIFYSFLSNELSVDEAQAVRRFTYFIDDVKSDLLSKKEVVLKGIGKLVKTSGEEISFYADELPVYYPILSAERVIRKNATHTVMVGEQEKTSVEMHTRFATKEKIVRAERWWIPALILAVIGIAAIVIYYAVLHPVY